MELLRALGAYAEAPDDALGAVAWALELPLPTAAQWHATFVERFYPYGSVYLGDEGFIGGEVRDATAGVFRALDATVPMEADNLSVLLDAYATVDANGWAPARSALLWEHVLPWTLPYLDRVRTDGAGPYRQWATLLADVLADVADVVAPPPVPARFLRLPPPGLPDPREDADDDLIRAVLAPVRLGAIITQDDLRHCADELHLAVRVGERRWVLQALLSQDGPEVLGWLAGHCETARAATADWPPSAAPLAAFWADRADRSARLLADLSLSLQAGLAPTSG